MTECYREKGIAFACGSFFGVFVLSIASGCYLEYLNLSEFVTTNRELMLMSPAAMAGFIDSPNVEYAPAASGIHNTL